METVAKTLILYGTSQYNPFMALARDVLTRYQVPFREISIDSGAEATERLRALVGQVNVPTLVIATPDSDEPFEPPLSLPGNQSVRGVDRGSVITAPNNKELENWLFKHGFLPRAYKR